MSSEALAPSPRLMDAIPSTLRILKRWVLWRAEERNGEKTKVPKTPTGSNASVSAPQTWSDFETVKQAFQRGGFDGVGFVLGGGVVGVDLDRCIDDQDNIAPWAQDIVHRLDSYTEISPSGRGLHVLVRAELPPELLDGLPKTGIKKQIESGGAIEIYWTGRYFTVTGHALVEKSVEARTKETISLIQELNGARPQRAVETTATTAAAAGDDEIIQRIIASDQKEKFHKLFFEGDTSEYGGDDSRADLALCSILAYWTNNDIQQIDRIFRRSKLYRPKWDELRGRETYGAITIQKALCRDEAPTKASTEQRRDGDYGHAQILAQRLNCRLRYATHRGLWMLYDGKRWVPKTENVISKMAADILFNEYLQELAKASSKEQVRAISERLKETTFSARINGALYFLKGWPGFVTEPEEWDKNPWLLNVNNGTINLKTGEFRPHNPEDLITLVAPVDYDPSADCPRWRAHIERFLPDPDVRRQVQRDLGKALPGAVLEESLPIWYGTGANGKTTTSRVIMSILGGYARRAAPDLLIQTKHERHPTEIADLVGSRVVFSVEVDEAKKLAEVLVKELTGGDRKKARFMRQDFFEFEQTFSIFMIVNHKPIITGSDEAIWRRIRLIPWTHTIPPEERRPQDAVLEELLAESSGILNWLLDGLRDWQRDRFWTAEAVRAATDEYRAEQDVLKPFLDECCVLCPHCSVPVSVLYSEYLSWCERTGETPISKRYFRQKLTNRGVSGKRGAGGVRLFHGIRLKPQEKIENRYQETDLVTDSDAKSETNIANFLPELSETASLSVTKDEKSTSASSVGVKKAPDADGERGRDGQDKYSSEVLEEVAPGCGGGRGAGGAGAEDVEEEIMEANHDSSSVTGVSTVTLSQVSHEFNDCHGNSSDTCDRRDTCDTRDNHPQGADDSSESLDSDLNHQLACHRIKAALARGITDPVELSRACGLPICLIARYAEREPRIDAEKSREVLAAIEAHRSRSSERRECGGSGGGERGSRGGRSGGSAGGGRAEKKSESSSSITTGAGATAPPPTRSTEPPTEDALISELRRRYELQDVDVRILREVERGGSMGKTLFDISTNLGMVPYEALQSLQRLRSLRLVEEIRDALGAPRWRRL